MPSRYLKVEQMGIEALPNLPTTPSSQCSSLASSLLSPCEATWSFSSRGPGIRPAASCDCPDARWPFPNPSHEEGGLRPVSSEATPTQFASSKATGGAPPSYPGLARKDRDNEWRDSTSLDREWWCAHGHFAPTCRLKE